MASSSSSSATASASASTLVGPAAATSKDDADDNTSSIPHLSPEEATEPVLRALLEANRPFLLTGIARAWRATREWVADVEADDFVTPDRLVASLGGQVRVPVVTCGGAGGGGEYGEEPRREMTLAEYAALWTEGRAQAEGLYLKDFHFVLRQQEQQQREHDPWYAVPPPLDDDWLNAWWDEANAASAKATAAAATAEGRGAKSRAPDDYRFLYLGPAGSRTPMHHDVLCSYSWSANLAGRKRWALFHPRDTPRLLHTPADWPGAAPTLVPDADSPLLADVPRLTVEQGPGELLFVPSGWHHQVTNLTGCLSLNHNWLNASALGRVWAFLRKEAQAVRARLAHLEASFEAGGSGWARQCEAVLRANAAMGLTEWAGLLVGQVGRLVKEEGEQEEAMGGRLSLAEQQHRQRQRRRDLGRAVAVLRELRGDASLLDSLFPPHLEPEAGDDDDDNDDDDDVWPPPTPPAHEALRPLVAAWLDEAIAAGDGVLLLRGGGGDEEQEEEAQESRGEIQMYTKH